MTTSNLKIDLSSLGISMVSTGTYRVRIAPGVVKETGNNRLKNPEISNAYTFNPTIAALTNIEYKSPLDGSGDHSYPIVSNVPAGQWNSPTILKFKIDKKVHKNTGNIYFKVDSTTLFTISVADSRVTISDSGADHYISISITSDMYATFPYYKNVNVSWDNATFADSNDLAVPASNIVNFYITNYPFPNFINYQDMIAGPADNQPDSVYNFGISVVGGNGKGDLVGFNGGGTVGGLSRVIRLTLNFPVYKNTGNFYLKRGTTTIATIPVSSSNVGYGSFSYGYVLSIDFTGSFLGTSSIISGFSETITTDQRYYITWDEGVIVETYTGLGFRIPAVDTTTTPVYFDVPATVISSTSPNNAALPLDGNAYINFSNSAALSTSTNKFYLYKEGSSYTSGTNFNSINGSTSTNGTFTFTTNQAKFTLKNLDPNSTYLIKGDTGTFKTDLLEFGKSTSTFSLSDNTIKITTNNTLTVTSISLGARKGSDPTQLLYYSRDITVTYDRDITNLSSGSTSVPVTVSRVGGSTATISESIFVTSNSYKFTFNPYSYFFSPPPYSTSTFSTATFNISIPPEVVFANGQSSKLVTYTVNGG